MSEMVEQIREKVKMTVDEFNKQYGDDERFMELIDGEDEPMTKDEHQHVVMRFIAFLLRFFSPDELRTASVRVYVNHANYFEPDIFWVSAESQTCRLGADDYWYGAPDFVIEVLSPSTERRDRGIKFNLYEQFGTREYWLVNGDLRFVEVYQREDEKFKRVDVFGIDQTFISPILAGQTVEIAALFGINEG